MSLPGILQDVAELAGIQKALELARRYGGTQISISDDSDSVLVQVIGQEAAARLVERRSREKVMVPMANVRGQRGRQATARQMLDRGASVRDVALACDIHERTVFRLKAAPEPVADLFDRGEDDAD